MLSKDGDPAVRSAACECLGTIAGDKAVKAIMDLIKDDSWQVRISAANALASAIGPDSAKHIVGMLKDSSLNVIEAVKDILAKDIQSCTPHLEKILEGDDELAKKSAIEVLSRGKGLKL